MLTVGLAHSAVNIMVKLWAKGSYLGYRIDVLNWAPGVALNPAEFVCEIG